MKRPRIFIGSSTEGLDVARAVEQNLCREHEVTCWDHMFKLGRTVYDELLTTSRTFDFAILVVTPDDITRVRGQEHQTARDNVILELGLFLGLLGPDRTFVLLPQNSSGLKLPTDLLGVVHGTYDDTRSDGQLRPAVSPFTTDIRNAIRAHAKSRVATEPAADSQLVTVVGTRARNDTEEFYQTFKSYLRKTSRSVILVGSGFGCLDRHATDMAASYLRVLTGCALRHKLVRVEMAEPGMKRWGRMLVDYLAPLQNVEILLPRKSVRESNLLKDICLMDPGTRQAVVEMMVPRYETSATADVSTTVAGEGLFIRSPKIADSFCRMILDMRSKKLIAKASIEQLREYFGLGPAPAESEETAYYFAYGSNMRNAQMCDRVSSARCVGVARLPGYRQCFNISGTIYDGGVCNIVPGADDEVWGVLYRVNEAEFCRRMDFYEGVGQGEYERCVVNVVLESGEQVPAYVYLSARPTSECAPARTYLNILLEGARQNGLPREYLRKMEGLVCAEG